MSNSRVWSIDINGQPFISHQAGLRQFRVVFDVQVSPGDAISFADIKLTNMDKATTIAQRSGIVLRAGFEAGSDVIFTGFVTNVLRERDPGSPEVVTRLLCRSGSPVSDRGSVQHSFGKGTKVEEVIRALARAWPIPIDIDNGQFSADQVLTSGYVVDGDIPAALDELAYAYKFDWVQEKGRLVVTKPGMSRITSIKQVNQFAGMIGIPEVSRGPNGIGVFTAVQLDPFLRINGRINVQSEFATFNTGNLFITELSGDASANGEYNVFSLRHSGDSHGDTWRTEIDAIRAGSAPDTTAIVTATNGKLIWGAKVTQEFRDRVREIGSTLRIDPNWLMAVMGFETGYTFSPSIRNPGSSATGLIQFIESTAISLGTTTAKLARMTAVQQLDYVEAYYQQYAGRIRNLGDAYLAVLWPVAVGRPDSYVMWQRDTGPYQAQYAANSGLDVNRDGTIIRGEAVASANQSYMRGQSFVR